MTDNDRKFIALIDAYKTIRKAKGVDAAKKYREKAYGMIRDGLVSEETLEFIRYY